MLLVHVWGPAFGLPSIDAECLSTIIHLHNALPSSAWRLIPSNDPSVSPSNFLPALNHDGIWISGYSSIIRYLVSNRLCDDLDQNLTPAQRADTASYGAFISAHAAALVDLSLYVSATNWAATTRPAFSSLLSFPLTWTVPTLIRAEAITRVEHLGLAELDTDFDPHGSLHLSPGRDALPESLRRHLPVRSRKNTVQEEMAPEQAAAIRLFALTEDCLTVLDQLFSSSPSESSVLRSFPGTPISSLDCLAFAHLALMINPAVPRAFLADCMDTKTPRLRTFVNDMMLTHITRRGDLPWAPAEKVMPSHFGARLLDSLVRHVPGVGEQYTAEVRSRAEQGRSGLGRDGVMLIVGALTAGLAAGWGVWRYRGLQPFGADTQAWRTGRASSLGEFGELGTMLGSVLGPLPAGRGLRAQGVGEGVAGGQLVDIDSDVD